jgi:hypothetical protein
MENGKQPDYRQIGMSLIGKLQPVLIDPGPMTYAVNTLPVQVELTQDIGDECRCYYHRPFLSRREKWFPNAFAVDGCEIAK